MDKDYVTGCARHDELMVLRRKIKKIKKELSKLEKEEQIISDQCEIFDCKNHDLERCIYFDMPIDFVEICCTKCPYKRRETKDDWALSIPTEYYHHN